ncbi:MAG: spore maturation protein, partial [Alphaproteobacteria bacterium]|nr:spore maturation protein [Alphaproteobacteria bacterium]
MNVIFFAIVAIAFLVAGARQIAWDGAGEMAPMEALGAAMIKAAEGSVTLAIGLIGVMALFLGLMKVAEAGGLLVIIARTVRPLMVRLFPEVPADHPAMGAIILNMSANALGLGNAATPFGIRAMQELDRLNPAKGTASNAMVLFLAINTSSVTL